MKTNQLASATIEDHPVQASEQDAATWQGSASTLFRREALEHYTRGQRSEGDVLRLTPTWTRWTYWLLLVVVAAGLFAAAVFTIDDYAGGPAVVIFADQGQTPGVVALLPGHVRPLLQVGMPLRLELNGYPYAFQSTAISVVEDRIVGLDEVEQQLGSTLAGTLAIEGPVVMVQAQLSMPTFQADGRTLAYFEGMQGHAEVRTGSERILFMLVPGLKSSLGVSN